ncbi:hypothetical protein M436DRAFT_58555 [Aureobasidium namibiae CBS 147.97]|uniref:Uncharacterized protein n=1 Tax=Aureobasidium namibiae CBS 147.97 TaxID=1043004 RepID=A0A074W5L1_9PEZI|nr:uncharacterized protein M436DRAFT_58555 [Aureobasidium namibiae CBS 147.97]KEQ68425.1 hypothetical protein M436DRAFT_58555 [Aureobasidium namibiae CBS 147.97]
MHLVVRNTILIGLAALGYVALWKFASDNGTFALMRAVSLRNRLPGTGEEYATEFTRWRWLDEFLRSLVTIFWPMVNGTRPGSSLMCFYFAGQGIVAWILTALEGQRRPNKENWTVISLTTAYGLLFQGLGIGIVGPLFLAFSPLGDRATSCVAVHHKTDVDAMIPATIGGIIIPTVLMSLHAPTTVSFEQKVDFVRLWQFFPLLFRLGQRVWTSLVFVRLDSYRDELAEKSPRMQRRAFCRVYIFGLCCAAITHNGTLVVSAISLLFPTFFTKDISAQFHPTNLFVPVSPFSGRQASTVGEGAHWFLQWDMTIMFLTYLVWAYFAAVKVIYPNSRLLSAPLILRLAGWCLLFGPMGAAMLAIWERDDTIFEVEEQKVKSRKLSAEELASLAQAEGKKE